MAFLYGLLRAVAAALRLVASARHGRVKARYEAAQRAFDEEENGCKAHEVAVGRPVDYAAQLRLLQAYQAKEKVRAKWIRAANRLEARKRRELWLKELSGKKIPYTFGLVDMAFVLHTMDRLGMPFGVDVVWLVQSVRDMM